MKAKKIMSLALALLMLLGTAITGISVITSAASVTYSDVTEDMWSYGDIMYVSEKGLMNGTGGSTFSPAVDVTRAMVVTVLYRMEGSPAVEFDEYAYADVDAGQFYSDAVIWAKEGGIVTSVGMNENYDDLFAPTRAITRQELATMFVRYATYRHVITEKVADLSAFKDVSDVADWASTAMAWCNEAGLINGTGNGDKLSPLMTATREQFAAIIHRFDVADFDYEYAYSAPKVQSTFTESEYPLVDDADIYVAVDGNDNNPGTLEKPLATFEGAVKKVRELKKTAKDGIVVAFKAGNYGYLDLELTADDAGSEKCHITYCKYGDGDVTFSNALNVTLDEFVPIEDGDKYLFNDKFEDNIYKVDLSKKTYEGGLTTVLPLYGDYYFGNNTCNYKGDVTFISILYDDEQSLELARFPNKISPLGHDQYQTLGNEVTSSFDVVATLLFSKRLDTYHSYNNIQFVGEFAAEYESNFAAIESYDKETKTIHFQEWISNGIKYNPIGFLQNISEELDVDGEYWLDVERKVLYVYNPTSPNYYLATGGTLLKLTDADYISFIGLDFKHSMDEGITINADNVTIDGAEIMGIHGSYIRDLDRGTFAVFVNGSNVTIKNSSLTHLSGGGITLNGGDPDYLISSNILIDNNYIAYFGQHFQCWTPGVHIFNCVGATVSHNEIAETPHQAINFDRDYSYIGDARCIDNIIEYNYIHDVVYYYKDAGAIYTGGCQTNRGNIFRYNLISRVGTGAWGMYLDDGICGQTVYGNIFHNPGGFGIMGGAGRDNYVCGNYIIGAGKDVATDICPMSISPKYTEMLIDDTVERLWSSTWQGTYATTMNDIPTDPEALKIWQERWPELFEALDEADEITPDRLDDRNLMINSAGSTYRNNYAFGPTRVTDFDFAETSTHFNVIENNIRYTTENDPEIFVNPALGDYNVKEDSGFPETNFSLIGRY